MERVQGRIEQLERAIQKTCIGCEMMTNSYDEHVSWCPAFRMEREVELKDSDVADTPFIVEAMAQHDPERGGLSKAPYPFPFKWQPDESANLVSRVYGR